MMNSIENISFSLETDSDLDPLIDQAGKATAVLIGAATHGTSEFYKWRARITRRLIEEKGFSFVAVEGDWPNCYQVNRYVKNAPDSSKSALDALYAFNRWPTWLWANFEVLEFVEWLANHNKGLAYNKRVGFYGLDVYSLWESLSAAVRFLEDSVPDAAHIARQVYRCFEPYRHYTKENVLKTISLPESCEEEVIKLLSTLQHLPPVGNSSAAEERFNAEQNALIVADAERYYRVMLRGDPDSWNLREQHMANTFLRLLDFYESFTEGPKGIIWAHNTHVGDARATDMADIDRVSIGQLSRDMLTLGETFLVGFGSYQGSVTASDDWGAPMREMTLPPAIHESWERVLHELDQKDRIVIFSKDKEEAGFFSKSMEHRAVGAVYDPNAEFGNYVPTILSDRYDAFVYIDETSALHPIHIEPKLEEPPDTYPSSA